MALNSFRIRFPNNKLFRKTLPCRTMATKEYCPLPIKDPIVTVLDACSTVGKNLALLLKQNPHIKELRIYDDPADSCEIARDLADIDTCTTIKAYAPNNMRTAITGSHVVITIGNQMKPDLTPAEVFETTVDHVRTVAMYLAEFNPDAVFCIAKPPVEALVPMAVEEYKKVDTFNRRKIIGVTTFASMVANRIIAQYFQKDPADVLCPVIGGFGPNTTVPVLSQTRPPVEADMKMYNEVQHNIANAEEMWLQQFEDDENDYNETCRLSTVVAASRMVNSVVKALKGDPNCVECAFVKQIEHIEEFLPYMTSIIRLGIEGIQSSHMPKINSMEALRLKSAVPHILENILLGQTYATGDSLTYTQKYKNQRKCDSFLKQKLEEFRDRVSGVKQKVANRAC